jgi:hypothetical protein
LGRDDDAKEALGTAFKTFASDTDQGKVLVELAKQMQIAMPDGVQ